MASVTSYSQSTESMDLVNVSGPKYFIEMKTLLIVGH